MIIGIGNDLVKIQRIADALEKHGQRFEARCFTEAEQKRARNHKSKDQQIQSFAKRFAAKEAYVKALGSGVANGVYLRDIGVVNDDTGQPQLHLTGGALARLHEITPDGAEPFLHISLSDEPPFAQAFVVIEARMG